ncbi:MAG: hypothetical protein D3909_08370 [Candidatus Electrothrix sp. ATG1]|nr:hypothetical protein [Candidatus Electrothrix sp. ATG1]MCI5212619.1 hypothetical protein [Candidatus Electrothrix sp. ATG2]
MHRKTLSRTLVLSTLLGFFLSTHTAEAHTEKTVPKKNILKAIGKTSRSYRKTPTDQDGALTEKMIEKCILLKHEIDTSGAEATTIAAKLNSLKKEIGELSNYLEKTKEKIDKTKPEAVEAYNQKINLYTIKADEYEVRRKEYNGKVGPYQQRTSQFDKECKDQSYYEDDYQKVVQKLGYGM